jgi:hypothetical protein
MTNILVAVSALALLGGFISYLHYSLEAYAQTQLERVITEEGEDDMEYIKLKLRSGEEIKVTKENIEEHSIRYRIGREYVELNGELIPYNEDDQE